MRITLGRIKFKIMLLTDIVKYRNREMPVTMLTLNSDKKVWIMCPSCKLVRQSYWKVIVKANTHLCHSCSNKANRKDIEIGERFGYLVIIDIRRVGYSICECNCGEITEIYNSNLRKGHTISCGCLKKENFINSKICKKEEHGNWKGGITDENTMIRKSVNYKNWRMRVFKRDSYTCKKCGQVGGKLNSHHINCFSINKSMRLILKNGITLCYDCHKQLHNIYGNKTTINNLIEYYSLT